MNSLRTQTLCLPDPRRPVPASAAALTNPSPFDGRCSESCRSIFARRPHFRWVSLDGCLTATRTVSTGGPAKLLTHGRRHRRSRLAR